MVVNHVIQITAELNWIVFVAFHATSTRVFFCLKKGNGIQNLYLTILPTNSGTASLDSSGGDGHGGSSNKIEHELRWSGKVCTAHIHKSRNVIPNNYNCNVEFLLVFLIFSRWVYEWVPVVMNRIAVFIWHVYGSTVFVFLFSLTHSFTYSIEMLSNLFSYIVLSLDFFFFFSKQRVIPWYSCSHWVTAAVKMQSKTENDPVHLAIYPVPPLHYTWINTHVHTRQLITPQLCGTWHFLFAFRDEMPLFGLCNFTNIFFRVDQLLWLSLSRSLFSFLIDHFICFVLLRSKNHDSVKITVLLCWFPFLLHFYLSNATHKYLYTQHKILSLVCIEGTKKVREKSFSEVNSWFRRYSVHTALSVEMTPRTYRSN